MARRRVDACYRELGAELRKRRIAANLTTRELAYHLDWSPSTVSRVESGYIGLPHHGSLATATHFPRDPVLGLIFLHGSVARHHALRVFPTL